MRQFVLVCMLLLMPLQWSWAAVAWHGAHAGHDTVLQPDASSSSVALADADHGAITAGTCLTSDDPCWHVDDPQWVEALPAGVSLPYTAAPHFEYFAPTGSHIPAGPERPERPPAAC